MVMVMVMMMMITITLKALTALLSIIKTCYIQSYSRSSTTNNKLRHALILQAFGAAGTLN
jgi:hypothetical protein